MGLRNWFSNRFPKTETNGVRLGHRVFYPVLKTNRYQSVFLISANSSLYIVQELPQF